MCNSYGRWQGGSGVRAHPILVITTAHTHAASRDHTRWELNILAQKGLKINLPFPSFSALASNTLIKNS